jgi:proline iminopeptidase
MQRNVLVPILSLALGAIGCLDPDQAGNLVPATVEEDPTLPRIAVNDTVLHAEAFGDPRAPMLLFLHGGPGGDYRQFLPYRVLADEGYYVVLWDQRGTGLSKRHPPSTYTDDVYVEDLRQVIEHFSASSSQPVVLIGHSWGAMYATWFINTYGDYDGRVVGAVVSEPGAFTKAGLEDYIARQFPPFPIDSEELNDVAWADQFMSPEEHARADYMLELGVLSGAPKEHNDPANPLPFWRWGAVVLKKLPQHALDVGYDWTTHLGDYHHKVLFLRGELNENLPLAQQQELASHYASSEVITVNGVGHQVMWERQAESLSHIRAYLAEIGVPPKTEKGGVK